MKAKASHGESIEFSKIAMKAMRRAVRKARKTAKLHGVLLYVWRNGRVVVDRT